VNYLTLPNLVIFALGVLLSGLIMRFVSTLRSKVAG
jgi:hypothetical protein